MSDNDAELAPNLQSNDKEDGESVRTPTLKEKLYYFYTSPVIKFYLNSLTYITFIFLFGLVLFGLVDRSECNYAMNFLRSRIFQYIDEIF